MKPELSRYLSEQRHKYIESKDCDSELVADFTRYLSGHVVKSLDDIPPKYDDIVYM